MSTDKPPRRDNEPIPADYVSRNGASSRGAEQRALRLVVMGYILAIALPPAGFVMGIVIIRGSNRRYAKHGPWIVALSIVATLVWFLIFNSGIADTNSNDLS